MKLPNSCYAVLTGICLTLSPFPAAAEPGCSLPQPPAARTDAALGSSDAADRQQLTALQLMFMLHQLDGSRLSPLAVVRPGSASCCVAQRRERYVHRF
jgi:hypothetical protein